MPKTQPRAHSSEVSAGFSQKEEKESGCHWHSLQPGGAEKHSEHSSGIVCKSCSWTQWPGKNEAQRCSRGCLAISYQDKGLHPFTLPELAEGPRRSCRSERLVAEHIVCQPENSYYRNMFPFSNRCTLQLTPVSGADIQGSGWGLPVAITGQQSNKGSSQLPQFTLPHPLQLHYWQHLGQGTTLGFHGFGNPSSTTFLHRTGPLRSRWPEHRWHLPPQKTQDIFHHPTEIWKARVVLQGHLLENNRKASYQCTGEVPPIHQCLDNKAIHIKYHE